MRMNLLSQPTQTELNLPIKVTLPQSIPWRSDLFLQVPRTEKFCAKASRSASSEAHRHLDRFAESFQS